MSAINTLGPKIGKLPEWAKRLIEDLIRERKEAVDALNIFQNSQQPSAIWVEEMICDGEGSGSKSGFGPSTRTNFIQSDRISIRYGNEEVLMVYVKKDRLSLRTLRDPIRLEPVASNAVDFFTTSASPKKA